MTEWDTRADSVMVDPDRNEVSKIILETNKNCHPIQNVQHQDVSEAIKELKDKLIAIAEEPESTGEDAENVRDIIILPVSYTHLTLPTKA